MDLKEYSDYLLKVKEKIEQVLRLQQKLEERSQALILVLRNLNEPSKIIENLESLQNIYKKKLKIVGICEKGLQDAANVFELIEKEIHDRQSFFGNIKSKFPILISKDDYESQLFAIISSLFSELEWQIAYANKSSSKIKNFVSKQDELINQTLNQIRSGAFDINKYNLFIEEFSSLRDKERKLIEGIKKEGNPKRIQNVFAKARESIMRVGVTAKEALRGHPRLLAAQAVIISIPDVSIGSGPVAYYLGIAYLPAFIGICYFIEWLPTLIALGIEINKYRESKR